MVSPSDDDPNVNDTNSSGSQVSADDEGLGSELPPQQEATKSDKELDDENTVNLWDIVLGDKRLPGEEYANLIAKQVDRILYYWAFCAIYHDDGSGAGSDDPKPDEFDLEAAAADFFNDAGGSSPTAQTTDPKPKPTISKEPVKVTPFTASNGVVWQIHEEASSFRTSRPNPFAEAVNLSDFTEVVRKMIDMAGEKGWSGIRLEGLPDIPWVLVQEYNILHPDKSPMVVTNYLPQASERYAEHILRPFIEQSNRP